MRLYFTVSCSLFIYFQINLLFWETWYLYLSIVLHQTEAVWRPNLKFVNLVLPICCSTKVTFLETVYNYSVKDCCCTAWKFGASKPSRIYKSPLLLNTVPVNWVKIQNLLLLIYFLSTHALMHENWLLIINAHVYWVLFKPYQMC